MKKCIAECKTGFRIMSGAVINPGVEIDLSGREIFEIIQKTGVKLFEVVGDRKIRLTVDNYKIQNIILNKEKVLETKEAPVVEDVPVIEEAPVVEDVPVIDEAPVVEDVPVLDEAPVVEDVPVIDEAPVVEETQGEAIQLSVDEDITEAAETKTAEYNHNDTKYQPKRTPKNNRK